MDTGSYLLLGCPAYLDLFGAGVLLVTGLVVGFASGLLGVGGCFLMVPVQYWLLTSSGLDPTVAIRVAFGTSLAVALPTAASSAWGHYRRGTVVRHAGVLLGISGLLGAVVGGTLAAHLPGKTLSLIFGLAVLAGAVRMLMGEPEAAPARSPGTGSYLLWGFPLGIVCGISGIGGGILMIPVMVMALGFVMHKAVGTSSMVIIFISAGGILTYAVNGLGVEGLPPCSAGYVNLLQWLLLAGTSVPAAQGGVRAAHMLPAGQLRRIFVGVMVYVALKMLGVLEFLNL